MDGQKSRSPRGGGKRGCGGSPLLVSHVRGDICSSSTVYAQRGCEERRASDESCVSRKGRRTKRALERGSIYSSIGHIKRILFDEDSG